MDNSFSLYIHVPYCLHRCPYCDFNVHVRKNFSPDDYVSAIIKEAIIRNADYKDKTIKTIFFGGGTPSLIPAKGIDQFLQEVSKLWKFEDDIEISLEANPENLTRQTLQELRSVGVNRLSIGAQSLSDKFLKALGRAHNSEQVRSAVFDAKSAGFENINLDLMHSLPGQDLNALQKDLANVLALNIPHISFYSLTIEVGTPFYEKYFNNKLEIASSDLSAEFMTEIVSTLSASGYQHYEISNFSQPGFECRHNMAYWQGKDYLGIGPGAHSAFLQSPDTKKRWANKSMPEVYIANPTVALAWSEEISGVSLVFENLMLALRTSAGIDLLQFESLGSEAKIILNKLFEEFEREGFAKCDNKFRLTEAGMMIADSIIERIGKELKIEGPSSSLAEATANKSAVR